MVERYRSGQDNPDYEKNIWKPALIVWGLVVVMTLVFAAADMLAGG